MPGLNYRPASFWENKFRTPVREELLAGLAKPHAQLIEAARLRLREVPRVREDLIWQGLPWRWTFAFRIDGDPSRPWAYLVPEPGKPRLVLSLTLEELARFPVRKLTKPARDPLSHGVEVDGIHWVEWEITSRALLDEVLTLAMSRRGTAVPATG